MVLETNDDTAEQPHEAATCWTRKVAEWVLDLQVCLLSHFAFSGIRTLTANPARIRRIKCDETRPYCRKCTESGRKCDGPAVQQVRFIRDEPIYRPSTPSLLPEVSLIAPHRNGDERRAFNYFTKRAAPIFAGAADGDFWKDLVPRLAQTREFVWDTVICIGSLLEHVPYGSLVTEFNSASVRTTINHRHRQALKFYNRAIANVRELALRNEMDDSIALLSCVLFATVEYQQRNIKTARDLVKMGCRLLPQILTNTTNSSTSLVVQQVVAPFILRKAVLIATLGTVLPSEWIVNAEPTSMLQAVLAKRPALNQARIEFHSLVYQCYEISRVADLVPDNNYDDPGLHAFISSRKILLEKLTCWRDSFVRDWSQTTDSDAKAIYSYILMYWAVCYTSLAACASRSEIVFDGYRDHFVAIVEHAEIYLRYNSAGTAADQLLISGLEPGIIPPLYFCAMKCRDPVLRRKAVTLMRSAPRQENLWAFLAPERVAEKVILEEEEGGAGAGDGDGFAISPANTDTSQDSPRSSNSNGTGTGTGTLVWPPEERRFAFTTVVCKEVGASGGRQRLALQMSRFVFQPVRTRRIVHKYTWLDDGHLSAVASYRKGQELG
ncbi:hypothetical protein LTR20_008654 [Exophiala xenobiotica]|nr:hypothetical protein LTR20_008654 [Exophiala xenobiotica]